MKIYKILQDPEKWHQDPPTLRFNTNDQLDLMCVLSMNGVCSIWKLNDDNNDENNGEE